MTGSGKVGRELVFCFMFFETKLNPLAPNFTDILARKKLERQMEDLQGELVDSKDTAEQFKNAKVTRDKQYQQKLLHRQQMWDEEKRGLDEQLGELDRNLKTER